MYDARFKVKQSIRLVDELDIFVSLSLPLFCVYVQKVFGLYIHGKKRKNERNKKHVDVVRDKSPGRLDDGSCSCQELSARRRSSSKSRG